MEGNINHTIEVSVIIPTFRDWDRLSLCLEALEKQTFPSSKFEVIIINNDPSDTIPKGWTNKGWEIIEEKKPGSYAARNSGILKARGKILAFTDADCIPDQDWLSQGTQKLTSSGAPRAGGKINIFRPKNGSKAAFLYEKYFAFQQERNVSTFKKSVTGNFFANKNLFEKYGYFDEELMSGGDFFWNEKLSSRGEKIAYADMAIINHPSRASIKKITRKKQRTTSGYYKETYSKFNLGTQLLTLFRRAMPPFFRISYIRFESASDYIKVLWIRWYVELVGVKQLIESQWADKNSKANKN